MRICLATSQHVRTQVETKTYKKKSRNCNAISFTAKTTDRPHPSLFFGFIAIFRLRRGTPNLLRISLASAQVSKNSSKYQPWQKGQRTLSALPRPPADSTRLPTVGISILKTSLACSTDYSCRKWHYLTTCSTLYALLDDMLDSMGQFWQFTSRVDLSSSSGMSDKPTYPVAFRTCRKQA